MAHHDDSKYMKLCTIVLNYAKCSFASPVIEWFTPKLNQTHIVSMSIKVCQLKCQLKGNVK